MRESSGAVAHVQLDVRSPDGRDRRGLREDRLRQDDRTGSFEISQLEPGRYVVAINSNGPSESSPYAPFYIQAPARLEEAEVVSIGPGERVRNINMVVKRLRKRSLRVQVAWPEKRLPLRQPPAIGGASRADRRSRAARAATV